ncbi:MAG: YraN family protein, partial [Anaerolineae bacterium]|nr:YraN family protein [Anaerolineae bacterium]
MTDERRRLGQAGERLAEEQLVGGGYQILDRNWRDGRRGELDLIARDGDCLVI